MRISFAIPVLFSTISLLSTLATGCAVDPTSDESDSIAVAEADLTGLRFYQRTPFDGHALESLRHTFSSLESGRWTRNGGDIVALHWEGTSISGNDRASLVQEAFAWHMPGAAKQRVFFSHLTTLSSSSSDIKDALDLIGYSSWSDDVTTTQERAKLEAGLAKVLSYSGTHLLTGALTYDPGVDWENGLIVVDDKNHDIFIVQGSFGN